MRYAYISLSPVIDPTWGCSPFGNPKIPRSGPEGGVGATILCHAVGPGNAEATIGRNATLGVALSQPLLTCAYAKSGVIFSVNCTSKKRRGHVSSLGTAAWSTSSLTAQRGVGFAEHPTSLVYTTQAISADRLKSAKVAVVTVLLL